MIRIADPNNAKAQRNIETLIGFYELALNQHKPKEAAQRYVHPDYIQHNPLIADGGPALGEFFEAAVSQHPRMHVKIYRMIAVDDYVWAHVNFLNMTSDDPDDVGLAGVDIWKMDENGLAMEHWDVLQVVGTPDNAAPWAGAGIPSANPNGMF